MYGNQIEKTDRLAENIKKMYRDRGREITDDEAREASNNLVGFFKLLMEIDQEQKRKTKGTIQS